VSIAGRAALVLVLVLPGSTATATTGSELVTACSTEAPKGALIAPAQLWCWGFLQGAVEMYETVTAVDPKKKLCLPRRIPGGMVTETGEVFLAWAAKQTQEFLDMPLCLRSGRVPSKRLVISLDGRAYQLSPTGNVWRRRRAHSRLSRCLHRGRPSPIDGPSPRQPSTPM
jgi:hypothetical protein